MIFYFSGTGNSRWVAQTLASRMGDKACDLTRLDAVPDLKGESRVGIVFPVYAWGLPEVVADFAAKLPQTGAFTFGVGTCGSEAGLALKHLSQLFPLDSYVDKPVNLMQVVQGDPVETPIWDTYEEILSKYDSRGKDTIGYLERFAFYAQSKKAYAIIATGEKALYANIMQQKGVI